MREKNNLTTEEILTILQIEIDKMNEKSLTNQIEYAVYNEKREQLDLSDCKNVEVKIVYEIKNDSLIDKTMISFYSDLGINVFNGNDSFFNDLCYPFSISDSDVILKDRLSDIYQNYSLCDNGCQYDEINMENMSVTCSCQVKTEINVEVSEPALTEMVQTTFKDSNFGVIRCYNLVFSLDYKLKNIGFLFFSFFIIGNIICIVFFLFSGTKSILEFVLKEMNKNDYISKVHNPKKKKIIEDNSNSNNNLNSRISLYPLDKSHIKKKKTFEKSKTVQLNSNNKKIKTLKKKGIKKNMKYQPIFIFNYKYDNNYYKINRKKSDKNTSSKIIFNKKGKSKLFATRNNKSFKNKNTKLNKEEKCPGYYNLIRINSNNSSKRKPPESKYILDNYTYEEAVKYETRDFWRIYFIFLLSKENIFNTFLFKTPLESQPIRISIFIFNYSCDFALNALFYLNQNISDKYHYEGDSLYLFIFVNNLTITLFSIIFSYLLVKVLYLLTNSKHAIEALFREEEQKMKKNKMYKVDLNKKKFIYNNLLNVYKKMRIKIICYIIIELILMLFFFYFITAFCEVYRDTQKSLLYNCFISFILSIPLELLISFFVSIIYVGSIKLKIKFLYNLALFSYRLG